MSFIIYCIDTETTGLDFLSNDVIEVSLWRSSDEDQQTYHIKALNEASISDEALKVNGHKKEDILWKTAHGRETYKEPSDVISEIESWVMFDGASIEERVFLGQNPQFDYDFLREMWKRAGCKETFPFRKFLIDTIQIARFIDVCSNIRRPRYGLSALAKDFGVPKEKAHRADADVRMTKNLFLKQMEPIKDIIAEKFASTYEK